MKKLILLLVAGAAFSANAQTINVPTAHKTLVMKFTADWCGPCGAWGWTEMEGLITDAEAGTLPAIVVAVHNSTSSDLRLCC